MPRPPWCCCFWIDRSPMSFLPDYWGRPSTSTHPRALVHVLPPLSRSIRGTSVPTHSLRPFLIIIHTPPTDPHAARAQAYMEMGGPAGAATSNGAPAVAASPVTAAGSGGRFKDVPLLPPDPIIDLNRQIRMDSNPNKVDLGIGAYRDDKGQPYILQVVKKVSAKDSGGYGYVRALGGECSCLI